MECPICQKEGRDEKVDDSRWDNPVHPECVSWLNRWPDYAKNPKGRYGDDSYREYTETEAQ